MERSEFERLVRDALNSLYDQAALQTHPLAEYMTPSAKHSRGQQLRDTLIAAIERLRPFDREPLPGSPEWRPYLLLYGRYVEGENLPTLQMRLALSERQLRREHGRAIEAVAGLLWDQLFPEQSVGHMMAARASEQSEDNGFPLALSPLDVVELIQGVVGTVRGRATSEGIILQVQTPDHLPHALADRVILRQILLSVLSYVFDVTPEGQVFIGADLNDTRVLIWTRFTITDGADRSSVEEQRALSSILPWAQRLHASVYGQPMSDQPTIRQLVVSLPRADQPVILVVDDQEVALRLYQRYLSQTGAHLVGLRDGSRAVEEARRLQPQAIVLDVMMPQMDGWEILQTLQANPFTRHIPVIVCSVWEEPELALSLGAVDFLNKPITQSDFLAALARLGLLRISAGSPSTRP